MRGRLGGRSCELGWGGGRSGGCYISGQYHEERLMDGHVRYGTSISQPRNYLQYRPIPSQNRHECSGKPSHNLYPAIPMS